MGATRRLRSAERPAGLWSLQTSPGAELQRNTGILPLYLQAAVIDYGEPQCIGLSGRFLDEFVGAQILTVLQPASLELSLAAEADLRAERYRLDKHWKQRLEHASYEADRAERQHAAVEPENRLVARELEHRWETALEEKRKLEEEYDRFCCQQSKELSAEQREAVLRLSHDVPSLWNSPATRPQDRQEIIRALLEQVTVNVKGDSDQVEVASSGREVSRLPPTRATCCAIPTACRLSPNAKTHRRAAEKDWSFAEIAKHLNDEGFHPPKRTKRFTGAMVANLLSGQGLHGPRPTAMVNRACCRNTSPGYPIWHARSVCL